MIRKEVYELQIFGGDTFIFSIKIGRDARYSNPSLKKMGSMIEMNKAMIDANSRELIPDLMVQGMLMRMRGMILTSKAIFQCSILKQKQCIR